MLDEPSAAKKVVEQFLINLMDEKLMSAGIQVSSMRGAQASPSNPHRYGPSQPTVKKRTKHRDDLVNVNLILTILPDYISPLVGVMSCDNVSREFDYTIVVVYLPKGIHAVRMQ
jgi:hypothetical protein